MPDSLEDEFTASAGWRRIESRDGEDATRFRNILTGADAAVSVTNEQLLAPVLAIPFITPLENEMYWAIRRRQLL